ncbi:flagellar protein FlgN [bacterium]|nr:flagellar protein FlgN [bacterium]
MEPVYESDGCIKNLIANLESQLEIHTVLHEVLGRENQLPASCSLGELKEIHSIRDFATKRIFELERDRLVIMETYKKEFRLKANISLKDVIQQSKGEDQKKLLELRQSLLNLIKEIRPVGKRNAETAIARIACFNEIQGVIDKSFNRTSTYSGKGIITKPTGACFLKKSI